MRIEKSGLLAAVSIPPFVMNNDVVADLPKVVSPLRSIGQQGGVDLLLVSVEVWPDDVVIRVRGRPSRLTRQMAETFEAGLEKWHAEGAMGPPPAQPADRILDFTPHVSDDRGTAYELWSAARGGTGTEFHANWTFVPGPPEGATLLAVHIDGDVVAEVDLGPV